jgi:glucoamylase
MRGSKKMAVCFLAAALLPLAVSGQSAPGGPGDTPTWTPGSKEAVGTAITSESHVWFTLQGGALTEVYYPRLDVADVRSLEFAVTDGKSVWIESRDLEHSIDRLDERALLFRQTSRHPGGHFTLTKTYVTDPDRNSLLIDVTFRTTPGNFRLYVFYRPALNNSGAGNSGSQQLGALTSWRGDVASALVSSEGFTELTSGFAGLNDGFTDLLLHQNLTRRFSIAENGNIIQTARLPEKEHFTLALGFGPTVAAALDAAHKSIEKGFADIQSKYVTGWSTYISGLRKVDEAYRKEFDLSAMVLRAHEDKTYPGAMIASMTIPWGFAVKADDPSVGGYHLVWARDLYEVATALLAAGDRASADRALVYLLERQQKADGSFPQNSWLDGRPYWPSLQMDEVSYPLILAWQLGRTDRDTWAGHLRPAAEFILARGPSTPQERWEEEQGYSPSTIAAEIAGLVCAAAIARRNGAGSDSDRYLKTADDWAANIEKWTVTTTGHLGGSLASQGYYIRINNNFDPNDGYRLAIHNGGGTWDERDIVDAGFLELVRLGIRPADDPTIMRSVAVVDSVIRVETPHGPAWYRYNRDGYGEKFYGGPYDGTGVGRLWPLLTGERGEYEIALGRNPLPYIETMMGFTNSGGMISEQIWDRAEPSQMRFVLGQGTGSATPLAWSMAQFIRLIVCAEEKRIVEMPDVVAEHFLHNVR